MLKDKNILIGVSASIAAYKIAELTRLFIKIGANVKVVMSKEACNFITPLTLSTLSKNPVMVEYFNPETGEWNNHVELALWADIFLIAPATANTMAKITNGICDNLLCAVYLSAKCPVYIAPAMDLDMWKHDSTQQNISQLQKRENIIIPPEKGELASGLNGEGRLAEPEAIIKFIENNILSNQPLKGKNILITAGPTQEQIDPVRYISNHSSGKMGYAIAETCISLGATVTLISGPTSLSINKSIKKINVLSADDMYNAVHENFQLCDICIMAAAIADYKIKDIATKKIKKLTDVLTLHLVKTKDILKSLGEVKTEQQILIGFALETDNEEANATKKLKDKNLDLIILNSLNDEEAGFQSDKNKITIIDKKLNKTSFNLKDKKEVAIDICQYISQLI